MPGAGGRAGRALVLAAMVVLATGCASGLRKFPLREPTWVDVDQRPFRGEPEEFFSPFGWDGADQTVFRPITRFFAVDPAGEAVNVNALDEVADSSWFRNRIGRFAMTPEQVARGSCRGSSLDPSTAWTVTGAKPNGANPGFLIKAEDGRRYLLKFDGVVQGPRATAADVVGSRLYHAAGFYVPCNEIVLFDRSILSIDPEAKSEDATGEKIPLTEAELDRVFEKGLKLPDGRYRANASRFIDGKPIGPWTYDGRRSDDPNDVIHHEDRRELRGSRVLAAWTNHFDAREQNTLGAWIEVPGGGYVRHYVIDFGDCFGSIWEPPMLGRRIGLSNYFDVNDLGYDLITFGFVTRPWDTARFGPSGPVFAYYDVHGFDPDHYQTGYPNPAFGRASERDLAWMARIVAHLTDAHIEAAVGTARFGDPALDRELLRILIGRRDAILRRYLGRLSPLTDPRVEAPRPKAGASGSEARLCLADLAVRTRMVVPSVRVYGTRAWLGDSLEPAVTRAEWDGPDRVCVPLPAVPGGSRADPRYLIVDVAAGVAGVDLQPPTRVHLYHLGGADYRVVGLERPYDSNPPG